MITSRANAKIKWVRGLQARRAEREAAGVFVVEGVRLLEEAAHSAAPAHLVLHTADLDTRGRAAVEALKQQGAPVEAVTPEVMAAASDAQSPPGLLAVVPLPRLPLPAPLTFALVLDRLGDPGNLGTVLRTAAAAGVQAVFLTPGTVDPYNPKVVRAAMGAHFHLPLVAADWAALPAHLAGLDLWRAESGSGLAYDAVDWRRPCALLIGAEASGPGDQARALAPQAVHIFMPGPTESLNAALAAGILLFEAARQRRQRII
ncbi:MAG: RNA methyltransferase [Anaerolineales bacterium]|nr:RNA methyltransferase [Anaerolineales bacterium]